MNLLSADMNLASFAHARLLWDRPHNVVAVSGSEPWYRASRRLMGDLSDTQGHPFPLRNDLWVTVYPPREGRGWRVESDALALAVVGRADSADDALNDWRKRFQMIAVRF